MSKVVRLLAVALVVAISVSARPAVAGDPEIDVRVSGGGVADFQDTPYAVNTTGYTDFSVGATVYADGSATGSFVCMIPAVVIISGEVLEGTVNDDGSVTLYGLAHGWDSFIPGPFTNLPFMVTLREGGPGVGGFDYRDDSGIFDDDQFDTELVRRGMIRFDD
jgi:hypothetical protein